MQQELTMVTVEDLAELGQVEGGTAFGKCAGSLVLGAIAGANYGARIASDFGPYAWAVELTAAGVGAIAATYASGTCWNPY